MTRSTFKNKGFRQRNNIGVSENNFPFKKTVLLEIFFEGIIKEMELTIRFNMLIL